MTKLSTNSAADTHPEDFTGTEQLPETTKVQVTDGNVKVETSSVDTKQKKVAIEKPPPRGFMSRIWKKISGLAGGTITLDVVTDQASQVQALGLRAGTWKRVFYIAAIGLAVYLVYEIINYILEVRRDKEITAELIQANTTDTNKVVLVNTESIETYRKLGYEIVTR